MEYISVETNQNQNNTSYLNKLTIKRRFIYFTIIETISIFFISLSYFFLIISNIHEFPTYLMILGGIIGLLSSVFLVDYKEQINRIFKEINISIIILIILLSKVLLIINLYTQSSTITILLLIILMNICLFFYPKIIFPYEKFYNYDFSEFEPRREEIFEEEKENKENSRLYNESTINNVIEKDM